MSFRSLLSPPRLVSFDAMSSRSSLLPALYVAVPSVVAPSVTVSVQSWLFETVPLRVIDFEAATVDAGVVASTVSAAPNDAPLSEKSESDVPVATARKPLDELPLTSPSSAVAIADALGVEPAGVE